MSRSKSTGSFIISSLAGLFLRTKEPKQPECGHKLHASAPFEEFCPVCQVDHCVAFLNAIAEAWEKSGGPFRDDYESKSATFGYVNLRLAWRAARLELCKLVAKLEKQAIIENRMDSYAPPAEKPDDPLPTIYGAQAALARYRLTYKYPVVDFPLQSKDEWYIPDSSPKQKKEVRFDEELVDGSTRKSGYFNRKHPKYVRGPHAAPPDSEFENTTCTNDMDILLSQSKIFFTEDLGFHAYADKPEHWPEFEGTAGCHPRWEEILAGLENYSTWWSSRKFCEWYQKLEASGVDGFAIVTDNGKIVDFVILRALKEDLPNLVKPYASWISLSEAGS